MSKHIVIFQTENEYTTFKASADYAEPNVAYVKETKAVYFNGQKMGGSGGSSDKSLIGQFLDRSITSIDIPTDITTIGKYALACLNIGNDITVPSNITSIGEYAFAEGTFKKIKLPNTITKIGSECFNASTIEEVNIPTSIDNIPNYCFQGTKKLKSITIPSNVKTIGRYAFYNSELVSAIIEEGCTSIEGGAFSGSDLEYASIPSTVTSIKDDAFHWVNGDIIINATVPPVLGDEAFADFTNVYVPDASFNRYAQATNWKKLNNSKKQLKRISEYTPKS